MRSPVWKPHTAPLLSESDETGMIDLIEESVIICLGENRSKDQPVHSLH